MYFKKALLLIFICSIIVSCGSKKNDPTPNNPPPPPPSKNTLSNFNIPPKYIGDANFSIPLPTTASKGTFTFTSDNPAVATIKGDSIVIKGVGAANITANQTAAGDYLSGSIVAIFNVSANVFITGYSYDPQGYKAEYWKNGNIVNLQGRGFTSNIVVQGNDVYVGGTIDTLGNVSGCAGYWKNGAPVIVTQRDGEGMAIAVVGKDVYVAGFIETNDAAGNIIATVWKNGAKITLQDVEPCCKVTTSSTANGITVSNGEVYICGTTNIGGNGGVATVWKASDGTDTKLSETIPGYSPGANSTATNIRISGNDTYVTGTIGTSLVYWKNNVPVLLDSGIQYFTTLNSLAIAGSDVYIVGNDYSNNQINGALWKNGVKTIIAPGGVANDVFVNGSDVYFIGDSISNGSTSTPVCWLNGNLINLHAPTDTRTTGINGCW